MSDLKTRPTGADVDAFLAGVAPARRRDDALLLLALMRRATGLAPAMWGPGIVGFGRYHYRYASGREGDWFLTGFAPRKQNLVVYIMSGFAPFADLLAQLGRHRTGSSCLYLNGLAAVDLAVLERMVAESVAAMRERYPAA
ncbi:MAG: DUF1801 domain-containing protein [Alphaproteobacteria bacterium]